MTLPATLSSKHPSSFVPQVNQQRSQGGERPFDSARNAAAGSLRLLDSGEAAARRMSFVGYQLLVPGAAGGGGKVGLAPQMPTATRERQQWACFHK